MKKFVLGLLLVGILVISLVAQMDGPALGGDQPRLLDVDLDKKRIDEPCPDGIREKTRCKARGDEQCDARYCN